MLLLIICIVCWGVWSLTQKMAVQTSSPLMMLMISSYVYSIIGPGVFMYMKLKRLPTDWDTKGFMWTVTGSLIGVIASLSYAHAAKRNPVYILSAVTSVYPIISILLSWAFLNEQITLRNMFGMCLVVLGMFLVGV